MALDPLLLSRLTGRGIAPKVARNLMESLGVETARERLDEVERMIAGKKTPGPGFFVNFMRSPDDYRPRQTHGQLKTPISGKAPAQPRLLESEPDPDQVARQRFEQLSPTERAQETVRSLKVVYGSRLESAEYKKLGEVLEVEALDAAALRAEAARALATGTCDAQASASPDAARHIYGGIRSGHFGGNDVPGHLRDERPIPGQQCQGLCCRCPCSCRLDITRLKAYK